MNTLATLRLLAVDEYAAIYKPPKQKIKGIEFEYQISELCVTINQDCCIPEITL